MVRRRDWLIDKKIGSVIALTAADNSNPLFLIVVSAIFGAGARLPCGAIGWCAEISASPGRYFGAKQHLTS